MLHNMPAAARDTVTSELKHLANRIENLKINLLELKLRYPSTMENKDVTSFENDLWLLEDRYASAHNKLIKDNWDIEIATIKEVIDKQIALINELYLKLTKNWLTSVDIDHLLKLFFDHLQTLSTLFSLYSEPFYVSDNTFQNLLYDFNKSLLTYQSIIEIYHRRAIHDSLSVASSYYTLSTYFQFLDNYRNELGTNIDYFQASISTIRLALSSLEHQILHKENSLEIFEKTSKMRKCFNMDLAEKLICSAQFFSDPIEKIDFNLDTYFIFLKNAMQNIQESIYILEEYPIEFVNENLILAYKIKNVISDKMNFALQHVAEEQKIKIAALENENTELKSASTIAPQACLFTPILQPIPIRKISLNIDPDNTFERIATPTPIYL